MSLAFIPIPARFKGKSGNPLAEDHLKRGAFPMNGERKLRILVAKPGLDGHDRGARIIARAFRDAGHEVIYTGCHQTPEQIVNTAIQEDVDLIGLSILSGAHTYSFPRVLELLKENKAEDILVIGGGIFPIEDIPKLKAAGIREIFEPGAKIQDINTWIKENIKPREAVMV
jgi:methylmalonyl-CoA mutase C-terminal domain/subunit